METKVEKYTGQISVSRGRSCGREWQDRDGYLYEGVIDRIAISPYTGYKSILDISPDYVVDIEFEDRKTIRFNISGEVDSCMRLTQKGDKVKISIFNQYLKSFTRL